VVLAFWNAEDPATVEKAAEVERAHDEHGDPAERFLHLAALAQRAPVAAAAAKRGLKQPVWVAGTHEKNAFRRFPRLDHAPLRAPRRDDRRRDHARRRRGAPLVQLTLTRLGTPVKWSARTARRELPDRDAAIAVALRAVGRDAGAQAQQATARRGARR
jgi:hypothetical protein